MVAPTDLSTKFALDVQAVNGLRVASKTDQAGLEAAARQFEALFLGMMLKSMREATPGIVSWIVNRAACICRCWTSSYRRAWRHAASVWQR